MGQSADQSRKAASAAELEAHDLRILTSIRRIIRAVDLHSRKLATQHGITGPQLICLLDLVAGGPRTATALSRSVHLSPSTLVGIVDRLASKGLVERTPAPRDRRAVLLSATESGRRLAASAPSPMQDTLAEGLGGLPDTEQAALAAALERIVALMEAEHLDAAPILETGPLQAPERGEGQGPANGQT